jgi:hypothetical protein
VLEVVVYPVPPTRLPGRTLRLSVATPPKDLEMAEAYGYRMIDIRR